MLSLGTWYQLRHTEKYNIPIGLRRDYRSSISTGEYPIRLQVDGQEMYWAEKSEVVIKQSEFNSLGLGFMHFKHPSLNKNNPYRVMKVWVDVGNIEYKEPMYGVQQLYNDGIKCKLIGSENQIESAIANKRFEEDKSWQDELAAIQGYKANDFYTFKNEVKKMSNNSGGIEYVEVTGIDDYDIEYEIWTDWKSYSQRRDGSRRIRYLEDILKKIESKVGDFSPKKKAVFKVLAEEFGVVNFDIDERYLLAEKPAFGKSYAEKVADKYDTHPATVWKAYWVHIEPWVRKEIEYIEEKILPL